VIRPTHLRALVIAVALGLGTGVATGQPTELIIRNGTIIADEGTVRGDLRIRNGLIDEIGEIGERLAAGSGAREIDADGLLVLPGGIDPHVHLGGNWVDDYTSGSAAALAGGITTISNFVTLRGDQVAEAMAQATAQVETEAIADVILHPIIGDAALVTPQLEALARSGHTSLKVFMVRPSFDRDVPGFLNLLATAGDTGILTMLHCEDAAIVSTTAERFIAEGRGALRYYPDARPVLAELVATQRAVAFSEATGAPVYLSSISPRNTRYASPRRPRPAGCPSTSRRDRSISISLGSGSMDSTPDSSWGNLRCEPSRTRTRSGTASPGEPSTRSAPTMSPTPASRSSTPPRQYSGTVPG